nr:serine hydrolase domain-containing protein [Saccharopolyspora sp. HNM0983]
MAERLASGADVGASVCVIRDGDVLVDLWGGLADAERGIPWTADTLVNTYSLTKTMTALVALALVDRGALDPDAPVAEYWPEFAAAGKQDVLVRHVLGHTSGVCTWADPISLPELYDARAAAAKLAAQPPRWTPGDGSGYQAINHGHLVGEIVRRITGRSLGTVLREEFCAPAGADYWLGAPDDVHPRVAALVAAPPPAGAPRATGLAAEVLGNPVVPPSITGTRPFLAAEIGGMNGQGNARSVAELQSVVSHGGVRDGHRFLSEDVLERIFDVQSSGVDRVLGVPLRFGLGYALPAPAAMPAVPRGRVCWWTGFGGSVVVNDLDRRLTVAYVMNRLHRPLIGAPNATAYLDAVYAAADR